MIGFGCVALALPNMLLFMSVGQLFLLGVWLVEGLVFNDLGKKFRSFFRNKAAMALSVVFFVFLLGLVHTENMDWGLDLVRILLPFLFLPVIGGSIPALKKRELDVLLWLFVASVVGTSIVGTVMAEANDFRSLSPGISHIRFGLMAALAILILVWKMPQLRWPMKVLALLLAVWVLLFLDRMHSVQGMGIVLLGLTILLFRRSAKFPGAIRKPLWSAIVLLPLGAVVYLGICYHQYYDANPLVLETLPTRAASGERYYHNLEDPTIEHGRYVWINVADKELARSWNARSSIDFDGVDAKGQKLKGTLVRYMASLGLRKDSLGMLELSDEDIALVESGVATRELLERSGLRRRVDMLIFELDRYRHGTDPSGNSFTMRFEFWRAAWGIWTDNFWIGVGTGDTPQAFAEQYEKMGTRLDQDHRFRAHNQFITTAVSLGLPGLLLFLAALLLPFALLPKARNGLAYVFLLACLVSFFGDDTLERQAGTTFVAFFYCVLVLLAPEKER